MLAKSFVALVAVTSSALAQLMIQTPASLIQCQPALLSWSGGTAPYYLAAIPGGEPSAAALKDFGTQSGTSYTWTVDIASGTSITLKITDSTGAVNYNQAATIQAGSSNSCLTSSGSSASNSTTAAAGAASSGAASATSAASSAAAAGSSAASSAAGAATSAASSGTAAAAGSTTKASSTAAATNTAASAAATTTKSGAGFPRAVLEKSGMVAAVLGVVGVALF